MNQRLFFIFLLIKIFTITTFANDEKHPFFGLVQVGLDLNKDNRVDFESDRFRIGWRYSYNNLFAKVSLDFTKNGIGDIEVANIIKDLYLSYKINNSFILKSGIFKTPVGMGFSFSGANLDVIKRGFDKKLAFERAMGVMLSGRNIGFDKSKGFGYDIMITGATGRSGAVISPDNIDRVDNGYMGRLIFDWTKSIHLELAYGLSPNADGNTSINSPDYRVFNMGLGLDWNKINFKAEYYSVDNIRGVKDWDMNTLAISSTYDINNKSELAIKDIMGRESIAGEKSNAINSYFGLNYYTNRKKRDRIAINYVYSDVDDKFKGVGELYRDDTILIQYQIKF